MSEDAHGRLLYLTVERTAVDDLFYVGKVSVGLPASSCLLRQPVTVMMLMLVAAGVLPVTVKILMMMAVSVMMVTVIRAKTLSSGMIMDMIMIIVVFRHHGDLRAGNAVPLVSGDIKMPSLQFQFIQSLNQDIAVNAQVEHRPEVHVTAYSRKTVIYCYFHH